jgi:flagellar motor switch protein FliN/FliY
MADEPTKSPETPEPDATQTPPVGPAPASAAQAADAALNAAQAAVQTLSETAGATPQALDLPNFGDVAAQAQLPQGMDLLSDVNLHVKIELGRTRMLVEDVLRLNAGSVVELDKLAGDPVDIFVNDRPVARGEVLVLNDNFCVRINEILATPGDQPGV